MAAYAALVSLMNDLEFIPNHPIHSFSLDPKQIASLSQTVHFLIDFMDTYDSHGCTREAAQVMESRIAYAAHAAHDVIESHVVDQIHAGSTLDRNSRPYFLLDLQKTIYNVDFVKRKAMQFKAKSGLKAEQPTYSPPASSKPLTSGKNVMVGFDAVAVRLMAMLTGEPSNQRVIPIVGMGGMGKTTLARNVYDHLLIQQHFDIRCWATISQEYSVESILTELLCEDSGGNFNGLGEQLHKMLWGRRYLIVLDDMWSVEAWDEVQIYLPDNVNGSCVIVTTRLSNLAAHLSSSPFEMNFLDDDQSWQLFCGSAFGEEDCLVELEEFGKRIVERCRGLPLSIVVIGGHLKRSSRVIEYWEMVADYMNPISGLGADEQCMEIISLSYEHLPAFLKPCFLYLGIFEEDKWINASELRKFWVAEGFVKHNKSLSLEEVAEDYLKDLIDRNLIIVRKRRWNRKVEYFVVHDIVRELCLKVAQQEKFLGVLDSTKAVGASRKRRIVVCWGLLEQHTVGALQLQTLLRSLMCKGVWFLDDELSVDLRLLRLSANVNFDRYLKKNDRYFPTANFQQLNLRHLDLDVDYDPVPRELPYSIYSSYSVHSSISLFWNIQTLIIRNLLMPYIYVPYEIWEMIQLRHLEFVGDCFLPDPVPVVNGDRSDQQECECIVLENLHTLLGVMNLRLTEEVCKRMPNIKKLSLSYASYFDLSGDCKASSYYCPHNLGRFNKLESLKYEFRDDSDERRDAVLSCIFPSSLEDLSLRDCHWEDLTKMIKSLPHPGSLELIMFHGPDWDLAEEEFPHLKNLEITHCDDLIYWNANSSNFPVLEILYFFSMPNLSEIPLDIGEIPTLRLIHLNQCSVSAAVSAMRIVVEQESLGNQDLLLEVNFCEKEQLERFQTMVQEECLRTNNLHLSYDYDKIKAF